MQTGHGGEQSRVLLKGRIRDQLEQLRHQVADVLLAGHIDKSHIDAGLALLVGNGQRQFGLAHPRQALQHHDGMVLHVLLKLLHPLQVVYIAGAAGRQRRQAPQRRRQGCSGRPGHWQWPQAQAAISRRCAQEQDGTGPGQALLVQAAAGPGQAGLQIALGMVGPSRQYCIGEPGHRRRLQRRERRHHGRQIALLGPQQGLGHAYVECTLGAGTVAGPQQRHVHLAGPGVVGKVGRRYRCAQILRIAWLPVVMQDQRAAGRHAMADPHQHMRPMVLQCLGQMLARGMAQGWRGDDMA